MMKPCAPNLFDGRPSTPDVPGIPAGAGADHEEENDEEDLSGSGVHDGERPSKERGRPCDLLDPPRMFDAPRIPQGRRARQKMMAQGHTLQPVQMW